MYSIPIGFSTTISRLSITPNTKRVALLIKRDLRIPTNFNTNGEMRMAANKHMDAKK